MIARLLPDLSKFTRRRRAAKLLGVRVLDHVILGRNGYFSFVEEGLM
jgi:DNA repair protein RadC